MNKENQKGVSMLLFILIGAFAAVMVLAGYFLFIGNSSPTPQIQDNQQQNTQILQDPTVNWNVAQNTDVGFQFKYPTDFGSKYASFQNTPIATVTTDALSISASGCLINPVANAPTESNVTINNVPFCVLTAGDPGAGQLYNSYNYTTMENGNYITLQYVVHTLVSCGPYMGTQDYSPCTEFMQNYDNAVVKTIETSVGTLQFNNK